MMLGMLLLGLLWSAVLPDITRIDVDTLIMAGDMTIGMALWMRIRRHSWQSIAEMSLAMVAPFLILLVPYWFGALPGHLVMSLGHPLMFIFMALAMLWRSADAVTVAPLPQAHDPAKPTVGRAGPMRS
jgi:hypothetical protein